MVKQQNEYIKGLDTHLITTLSESIRDGWNDFFLESAYCQNLIRFGKEEQTNYMGDLLNYFDDTVELLTQIPLKKDYQKALFDTISVLQLMYIGQDLIDELRLVFKMPASSGEGKMLIRTLRNELTGHPISRDRGKNFISSVFLTRNSHGDVIEYLRYHKDDDYKAKVVRHSWSELVKIHENYLVDNLNAILAVLKVKLKRYQLQLDKFVATFSNITFEGLVNRTDHLMESFFEHSALYSRTNLLYYFESHDIHPRYSFCTQLFTKELMSAILETRENIIKFRREMVKSEIQVNNIVETKIVFSSSNGISTRSLSSLPNIRYQFSKLREKHPIFGIEFFIETYGDDPELGAEILHMRDISSNDREFYCSYEYLRHLFSTRGLL